MKSAPPSNAWSTPGHQDAQPPQGAVQRDLQCRWRLPAPGRGFLQGELLQPQQLDRLALAGGKAGDSLLEPADLAILLGKVRFICRKGFMNRRQLRLAEPEAAAPAQAVDEPVACDRQQPGREGTPGIVALPDRVNGQQDVLDPVLDLIALQPG